MPQIDVLGAWQSSYPYDCKVQKPGGITVATNSASPKVPNKAPVYIFPSAMLSTPPDIYGNLKTNQAQFLNGNIVSASSIITVNRNFPATQVDSNGNWGQVGNNVLARSNLGASIWESRTCSIRNNTMVGTVAGTPGTLPTNWTFSGSIAGVTTSVVGTGTESGVNYIDIQWSGSGTGNHTLFFDAAITAAINTVWTTSAFVKLQSGMLTNTTATLVANFTGGGTNLSQVITPSSAVLGTQRFQGSCLGGASTTAIQPGLNIATTGAVSFTLRIGWPQCELNSNATTAAMAAASNPILTSGAAATRTVESNLLVLTGLPGFGSAFTIYASGIPRMPNVYTQQQTTIDAEFNSSNHAALGIRETGSGFAFAQSISSGTGTTMNLPVWSQGTFGKIALADTASDQAAVFNGGSVVTGTGALPLTLANVGIGQQVASSNRQFNGDLQEFAVWFTQRLPNTALQAITT